MACSAFALRVTTWGVNIGRFLTAFLTANLSTIYGWRTVPKIYAAIVAIFAVPFHLAHRGGGALGPGVGGVGGEEVEGHGEDGDD
eukprot:COSAG04_NODE_6433_length_1327_cov_1.700326_1_plen_84_part_10